MSLLLICAIAVAGLSVIFIVNLLRTRRYPAESVEVISLLDIAKNTKDLRRYLHSRILNSKVRFLEIQMPGRPAFIFKDAESAKVRNLNFNPETLQIMTFYSGRIIEPGRIYQG